MIKARSMRPAVRARGSEVGRGLGAGRLLLLAAALAGCALPLARAWAAEMVLPVPRVTIYPGDTITEAMLADQKFRASDLDGAAVATAPDALIGKVARQTLLPNQPIAATAVREPFAVKPGMPAVVYFKSGGLIISATAIPLQAGSAGQLISLRNTDSGTTIRGIVQQDGTVRVGMP